MKGATYIIRKRLICKFYFNPRSLWRERRFNPGLLCLTKLFQSTLPVKGATLLLFHHPGDFQDFNPRSLWRERPFQKIIYMVYRLISIHAPCEGSDIYLSGAKNVCKYISIHAPCEGSDLYERLSPKLDIIFQSTLPVKGATELRRKKDLTNPFQSTLPVKGATQFLAGKCRHSKSNFNPRSLWRERLANIFDRVKLDIISIHAPCEGSDSLSLWFWYAPCEGSDDLGQEVFCFE